MSHTYPELIKKIKEAHLLALPQSAVNFLELAKDPANGPSECAIPISVDPGLTSQILRLANSSFFGFRHEITTVQMALSLISVRTIKNFILWNAVFALLPDPKCGPFNLKVFVLDSLRRGSFAKALGTYFSSLDSEELFVAVLLQDITIPMLAQLWPKEYEKILILHQERGACISVLEEETFGWNHMNAGAFLIKEWGFGEELASKIAVHHARGSQNRGEEKSFLEQMIVRLSSLVPSHLEEEWKNADDFFTNFAKIRVDGLTDVDVFKLADQLFTDLLVVMQWEQSATTITSFHRQYLSSMSY